MKTILKQIIDNFIINHKIWFLKYWDNISIILAIIFLLTAFIGAFINSPFIICTLLIVELLLFYNSLIIEDYIKDLIIDNFNQDI